MAGEPGNVVNAQLVHHLLAVLFHRLDTDAQFSSNLLISTAFRDELQNLRLTCRQMIRAFLQRFTTR